MYLYNSKKIINELREKKDFFLKRIMESDDLSFTIESIRSGGGGLQSYPEGLFDVDEALEANGESSEDSEEPVAFPDLEEEKEVLGDPQHRRHCFGCSFVGEAKSAAVSSERLGELFALIRDGMGRTDPISLAQEVHLQYSQIREEANSTRRRGRELLPVWEEATILDHIRNHNTDPQVQRWIQVDRLQKVMAFILNNSVVVRNKKTGKRKMDKEQWAIYNQASLRWERLMKLDVTKMGFYDEDSHMSTPKGIINTDGKTVYNFFNDRTKRRRME